MDKRLGKPSVFAAIPFRRLRSGLAAVVFGATSLAGQTAIGKVEIGESAFRAAAQSQQTLHIFGPGVLAVDALGNAYVAVRDGVFRIDAYGTSVRVAGIQGVWRYFGDGGPAIRAGVNPRSLAVSEAGDVYLADAGNNRIRKIAAETGIITTVAGNGTRGF